MRPILRQLGKSRLPPEKKRDNDQGARPTQRGGKPGWARMLRLKFWKHIDRGAQVRLQNLAQGAVRESCAMLRKTGNHIAPVPVGFNEAQPVVPKFDFRFDGDTAAAYHTGQGDDLPP